MHVAALIGSPVAHSLSPVIHQAAFDAAGVDWRYVAFDVAAGRADEALQAMRALGIAGMSVTSPHKQQVAACVDARSPAAEALRSVNTVTSVGNGRLVGHSTDGDGFVAALGAAGVGVAAMRVVVLGAGAAARSVIVALAAAGAGSIAVVNRSPGPAAEAVALVPHVAAAVAVAGDLTSTIATAELVVNATSVGFGSDELPLDPAVLHPEQLVADLVYHPLDTALLRAARAVGARTFDGLGMLVHQAALQQQLWLGQLPDVAVMRAAAEAEFSRRAAEDEE